jgi:hypothetical protein
MEAAMTVHDHIQELRCELFACGDAREADEISLQLQAAEREQADLAAAFVSWMEDG